LFLAEANQWPADVIQYFGDSDECHMAYNFPLMPRIFMAVHQQTRLPIVDIMRQTPAIPENCQWAIFLRNHDELTLEMVTDEERDYMYTAYAENPIMRCNVGIRRRLAPLLDNSRPRIELVNGLLFSFPGTPIIYYGDELGMGDNVYLGDRNGVRTPMQWNSDRNGGFSRAPFAQLYSPPLMDAVSGYQVVNVEGQLMDKSSLLRWMRRIIRLRKQYKVFGRGTLEFIEPANRKILAYVRQYESQTILCVANLSYSPQSAELDLSKWAGTTPIELFGMEPFHEIDETPYVVTFAPYGFYWFLIEK
jgi:maltose alpha-D-glucosyltransferase/alpha-amylase